MNIATKQVDRAWYVHRFQSYIDKGYFTLIDENTPFTSEHEIPHRIPKKIILFWHDEEISLDVQKCYETIRMHNANYQINLFNEQTASDYIYKYYGQDIGDI